MSMDSTNAAPVLLVVGIILVVGSLHPAFAQIYQPPKPYSMWDTWLFPDGDAYHLFFLQSEPGVTWNTIGRAVSEDLVHWTPLPAIPSKGPKGSWDEAPTLTGMTVKHAGRYITFYGSASHGQQIGIMTSPDMKTWKKHPGNPTLRITPPHYAGTDWRDLCTFYEPKEKRWHGYVCAQTGQDRPRIETIQDKTLVAWVYLANTTQQGGSVLTLDHGRPPGDVFDAIVLGERAPGKWMGGSNFLDRTPQDQSAYPRETAGPDTLVQIAIAYKGKQVTIYRNAKPYASYQIDKPVSFGNGTAVVMGLRHLGASEKAGRFFAGAIEEARVYDVALDERALKALAPDRPSDPKPIGQWTFKDGSARDAMGTFPEGRLHGGARIVDGKLYLDGKDAYLDTPTKGPTPCVAHLVSEDLITWEYLPPVFADETFYDMEVPDYFELNGRHYLMFSSGRTRRDTSGRTHATGTYYVVGEARDGPYRVGKCPLLLGCGHGRFDNYVGRTIPFEKGRLLYHHTAGGTVTWGTPKLVRQEDDGTLWLQYWPGLAKLETRSLLDGLAKVNTDDRTGAGAWTVQGDRLTGRAPTDQRGVLWLPVSAANVAITCTIDPREARSVGLVWRWDGKKGAGLVLSQKGKVATVANITATDKTVATQTVDDYQGLALTGEGQRLRILVRAHRVEVYIDDRWILGTSMTDSPPTGRIGLLVDAGTVAFAKLRIAEIEPLPTGG